MPVWLRELAPILLLLVAIMLVLWRLPRVDLGHSLEFRRRRLMNWFPLGMTYAFLYFGRYNINEATSALGKLTDNSAFGTIFGIGAATYGVSFLINGPLTDRLGGRMTILISAAGVALANGLMGIIVYFIVGGWKPPGGIVLWLTILYGVNMYFQSFGAVSIVKVNAAWFHVRERGVFGAIFGILISLGIYFAFDWGKLIVDHLDTQWVFFVPSILLVVFWLIVSVQVKNTPGEAGYDDFDPADASSGDDGPQLGAVVVFKKLLTNPIIVTIACIEFCSGFLRQAIMHWYPIFAKQTDQAASFVYENWGMMLCVAGILGGVFAGTISDHLFHSRRGPVASILYGVMLAGSLVLVFVLDQPVLGPLVIFMSMAVIGVHGMLSGTASMDFGGRRNAGIAVGIIDGFVYAGTAVMSFTYARILPDGEIAKDPDSWIHWPISMIPVALIGFVLAIRLWNAKPRARKTG
jgi:OPA family glycerol-3-phosphate transporter-like MFS transporter